ncbi:hypothetical protein OOU_Y34scaffold00738g3 [Pyricularia oryzae Y34]|uniref:Uncharacterized protein n=1 Tax=Pyricularia oryzae (strain Y34) TaxID=1143189 RepID=A0AA97NRG4_PYRO3|nr:hypothetical protein OOU_Y34scaffold00738g3 [Pyricularia oryzae Y34]
MALLFIEIPAASLVFHDGNCLTQGLNSYDTPGQAAKTPACMMSFRVKERENGIKDSLVFECDNTLIFSEEPSFEVARACFHHYEHAKQGGETGTVAQPSA